MNNYLSVVKGKNFPLNAVTQKFAWVGRSGCHAKGQGILMYNGTIKPVEEINVLEMIMGADSKPRTVLDLCRGKEKMYKIIPIKGHPFIVNESHILTLLCVQQEIRKHFRISEKRYTKIKTGKQKPAYLVDISVKDYLTWSNKKKLKHKLFRVAVDFSNKANLPIESYFLGVLLGDGHMKQRVSVTSIDKEIIDEVYRQAKKFSLQVSVFGDNKHKSTKDYCLSNGGKSSPVGSNKLINILRELKLYGCGSGSKFIPYIYKTASRKNRLEILAGLLDTDGYTCKNVIDYVSKSKQLADDVCFIARSLGLSATTRSCIKTCVNNGKKGTYYRVCISGDTNKIPFRLKRKKPTKRKQIKDVLRTGFSVKEFKEENYYGFTLDGDGRYLLDDFTITHNSGKSYGAGKFAEELLEHDIQTVILDPVGIWYGLRMNADGKAKGYSIPIFGGEHGDVPLPPHSGTIIANLIVERGISAILDVSYLRKNERKQFVTEFAEQFFHLKKKNKSAVHLIIEEAQVFMPQRTIHGEERMLGAMEDIIKIGRNYGIGVSIISQRPQSVHKDCLNQTEALFAFQLNAVHERKAIKEWVEEKCFDQKTQVEKLSTLEVGECFLWSPQWLKILDRVKILTKKTFDTSKTPEAGDLKSIKSKQLAPVDLENIKMAMDSVIKEKKENDPAQLKKKIFELEKQLSSLSKGKNTVVQVPVKDNSAEVFFNKHIAEANKKIGTYNDNGKGTYNDKGSYKKLLLIINKANKALGDYINSSKRINKELISVRKQISIGTYNDKGIKIKKDIQSQQIEVPNKPFVDLKAGDIVELKKDGIYFTRKINLPSKKANLKSVFENFIKRQNNIKQVAKT